MTTFKEFVMRYDLEQSVIEELWQHLLMYRLLHWQEGLKEALR